MKTSQASFYLNVVLFFTLSGCLLIKEAYSSKQTCTLEPAGVYVAISAEAELSANLTLRNMTVHWWGISNQTADDWVGLWDADPTSGFESPLETADATGMDGGVTFDVLWDEEVFPVNFDFEDDCLPYWGGYVQNNSIIFSSCFRLNWNWMETYKDSISDMKLAQVALPGTHDAGAFGKYGDGFIGTTATKWVYTQDETFWQQLMLGVRYLDVRIAYYENTTEQFFVNHGQAVVGPLEPYLDDVFFFSNNTTEIIIFDIHQFTFGFDDSPDAKFELADILEDKFGSLLVPNTIAPNPTLSEIWASGGRIIVTYPEFINSSFLWDNVDHVFGNVVELDDLYTYMSSNIPLYYNTSDWSNATSWSAMTEFTPSTVDVAVNRWGGLRGAAAITNEPVTLWLRREWWFMINIISMDFIASSDVINVVIESNINRAMCLL